MSSTDLMNVSAFENQLPDASFAVLDPSAESLADGIGSSYPVIGYRGKVWSIRKQGESKVFVRPDDGTPAAFLDVVVLRAASYKSKSYYEKDSFDQDQGGARPICASLDGVTPDRDVTSKQADACALCPRNEWKTDDKGRKGRDCSDYKRLAVMLLPSVTTPMYGSALMEPVFLRVPPASLNDLAVLGDAMAKKGFHYSTYITRIGFQADKAHPQMTFRALQALTKDEAPIVLPMREDANAYRITGESEVGKPRPALVAQSSVRQAVQNTAGASTGAATQAQTQAAPVVSTSEDDEEAALQAQLAAMKAKKAAAAKVAADAAAKVEADKKAAAEVAAAATVNTGFVGTVHPSQMGGMVVEVTPNAVHVGGASTTAVAGAASNSDTGPADEADASLDARVGALLNGL